MSNNNNGLWLALVGVGVIADRPVIPNVPHGVGSFWIATDTGNVSAWNGTAWSNVTGSAAPSGSAGVLFAALPATPFVGQSAYVTNLTDNTVGATAAGAGTAKGLVVYDGTNWIVGGAAAPV